MKRIVQLGLLVSVSLAVSACRTSLAVDALPDVGNPEPVAAPVGLVYFLPYAELEVELSRRLDECSWSQRALVLRWFQDELDNLRLRELQGEEGLDGEVAALVAEASDLARKLAFVELESDLAEISGAFQGTPSIRDLWDAGKREGSDDAFVLEVTQVASVDAHYLPDTGHGYAISFASLANGLKQTELSVSKHPNGMLKSFNVEVDDRTGEVVQAVVRGALSLASAAGGLPLPPPPTVEAAAAPPRRKTFAEWLDEMQGELLENHLCTPEAVRLLVRREALEARAKETLQELAARQGQLALVEKALTATKGELAEAKKQLEALKGDDAPAAQARRAELEKRIKALQDTDIKQAEARVVELQKEIKKLEESDGAVVQAVREVRRALTLTTSERFDPAPTSQIAVGGLAAAARRWFDPARLTAYCAGVSSPCRSDADGVAYPKALWAYAAVHRPYGGNFPTMKSQAKTETHLVYREPVQAPLLICKQEPCVDDPPTGVRVARDLLVTSRLVDVPQLGALAVLPLTNASFENNTLKAEFSATGALVSLAYTTSARAEAAAETFEASADELSSFIRARREADKAKLERQTAEIDAETARLKALLEQEKAREELEAFRSGESDEEAGEGTASEAASGGGQ